MEESMISTNYMSRSMRSSDEESSWSLYLEDLMALDHSPSDASESSLSGLKSCRLYSHDDGEVHTGRLVSAKKRKITHAFVDHDLEDDACSPDHTPKAKDMDLSQFLMDSKDMIDQNTESYSTELRRKGLCLVPAPYYSTVSQIRYATIH